MCNEEFIDSIEKLIEKDKRYLDKEEIKLLYEYLKHQYFDYENIPLLELIRKISAIANE